MSLSAVSCSPGDAVGGDPATTFPLYTPTAVSGDAATGSAGGASEADGSPSMTPSSAPPVSATAGPAPSGAFPGSTATTSPASAATGSTITLMPTRPSVTLSPSLVATMTVALGVDTTGVDIEGAKAAYFGFLSVGDRAVADPTREWREEFAKYAVEPVLSAALSDINDLAEGGITAVGHSTFTALATVATTDKVMLRVCNDVSGVDYRSAESGASVKSGPNHLLQDVTVEHSASGQWAVSDVNPQFEAKC